MHCYSTIVLAALTLLSSTRTATAAPVIGMGLGSPQNNETMSILSDTSSCSTDEQCPPGSFCDLTDKGGSCVPVDLMDATTLVESTDVITSADTAMCRKDGDQCIHWRDCCSERCRRELVLFGKMRCLPQKNA
ncbi:hypothetical protein BDV18DRAFT_157366 [Aspergillus unguis]